MLHCGGWEAQPGWRGENSKAGSILTQSFPPADKTMNFRLILLIALLLALPAQAVSPPKQTPTPAPAEPATAAADAPPILRLPAEREETRRAKGLEQQLSQIDRATEVAWLDNGDDRFLALYRQDSSGKPFASLLILHDNRQHPDWPGIVRGLREQLSGHGWNTLSVAMPDYLPQPNLPPLPEPSAADTAAPSAGMPSGAATNGKPADKGKSPPGAKPSTPPAEPAAPTAPPEEEKSIEYPIEKVPDVVDERVRVGIAFLKKKDPAPVVIAAIGLPAGFAAKKTQTLLIKDVAGIVLIDPVQPEGSDFNTDLDALDLRVPILDIAPEFGPRTNPALRLANASRGRHESYQQRIIKGARTGFTGYETQIVKTVRGWGERLFKR